MKARRSGMIILVLLFGGLAVFTLIQGKPAPEPPLTPITPFFRVFPDLAVLDIAAIRLRSPETGKTFTLARQVDGSWQAPESTGTLDDSAAAAIARTMVLLPYVNTTVLGSDLTTYGFQPEGVLSLEIGLVNNQSHVVAVGYRTPTNDGYYALVDDRPELYILDRAAIDYLIKELRDPPVA